jgi:hypothetical protein
MGPNRKSRFKVAEANIDPVGAWQLEVRSWLADVNCREVLRIERTASAIAHRVQLTPRLLAILIDASPVPVWARARCYRFRHQHSLMPPAVSAG